jgi:hypothetical protein
MARFLRGAWRLLTGPRLDRRVVFTALRMAPRVSAALHSDGYANARDWLSRQESPGFEAPLTDETLSRADKAIRLVHRRMKCLARSMTIWWLAGDGATLRLGVSAVSDDGDHRFHAWVERNGVVINDSPRVEAEFLPLAGHALESADPKLFG